MLFLPYIRDLYGAVGIPIHRYRGTPEALQLIAHFEPHDLPEAARHAAELYAREHDLAVGDFEPLVSPFSLGAVTLADGTRVVLGPLNYSSLATPSERAASRAATRAAGAVSGPQAEATAVAAGIWGMKIRVVNLWLAMIGQIVLRHELPHHDEDELYSSVATLVPQSIKGIAQEVKLNAPHNQYRYELAIMDAVRQGDVAKVERAFAIPLQGKFGVLGPTPLRSMQNHVHNLNSQVSRVAINAGILPEKAYALSDKFFMAAEHCTTIAQCIELRHMCAQAFAQMVKEYRDSIEGTRPPLVHNAILLISRLIYDRCTVAEVAARLQVSSTHLERVFKQCLHQKLSDYILGEKIKLAQELLRDTHQSVGAIASILSFTDNAHFSHCFKRVTGLSPSQYRNSTLSHNQG